MYPIRRDHDPTSGQSKVRPRKWFVNDGVGWDALKSCPTAFSGAAPAKRNAMEQLIFPLPVRRFAISEASRILRMSRAQLYHRIGEGAIRIQKDGARTYVTIGALEPYVESCDKRFSKTSRLMG
jgi:hypothetical protein